MDLLGVVNLLDDIIIVAWREARSEILFLLRSSPILLEDDDHLSCVDILLVDGRLPAHLDNLAYLVL